MRARIWRSVLRKYLLVTELIVKSFQLWTVSRVEKEHKVKTKGGVVGSRLANLSVG